MKQMMAIVGISIIAVSCNTTSKKQNEADLMAKQYTIDSMKMEMVKQRTLDSMQDVYMIATIATPVEEQPAVIATPKRKKAVRQTVVYTQPREQAPVVYDNGQVNQPTTQTPPVVYQEPVNNAPQQPQKKGWSAKAKGAVIGGVAGAAGGAIINKKQRGVGAIVGGVLGAGAGLGIGAVIDKKNGR